QPLTELFANFDTEPLASASIAQVHAAQLHNGRQVIVKVVRPDIEPIIRRDLALMMRLAQLLESFLADARRLHAVDVVADYEITILDELDMVREAANANQIRRNFDGDERLYIPEVFWEYTRNNVMVMERVSGLPVDNIAALTAAGVNLEKLAERGVEIFFKQVFDDNFFHADMHPGNIMVEPSGRYVAVDFGIVGTLEEADKRYLAENFLGFFHRDYHAVAKAHLKAGWIPADTRLSHFESAIRAVCEPIFDKPLSEISFGFVLLRLFQVARRFDMQVQPQLVLLQKTLLNIEGLGRTLYPELDLWKTAKPYLERWMNEQVGWRGLLRTTQEQLPQLAETLPEIPFLLHEALQRLADMPTTTPDNGANDSKQQRSEKRLIGAIVGSALIISATLVYALSGFTPLSVIGMPRLPVVTLGLGLAGVIVLAINWPDD
ncbi:MAG: ubiquinone biosynthesis regulatory protein kinase UbiB, partial [Gammaproteobacteria bacterium]